MRVDDLYVRHQNRMEMHLRVYRKIHAMCESRIKTVNEMGGMQTTFEVPIILFGEGKYDPERAAEYVIRKLQRGGFRAWREGRCIHVDWRVDRKSARAIQAKAARAASASPTERVVRTPSPASGSSESTVSNTLPPAPRTNAANIRTIHLPNARIESYLKQLETAPTVQRKR